MFSGPMRSIAAPSAARESWARRRRGVERAEPGAVGLDAAEARPEAVRAVVAVRAADRGARAAARRPPASSAVRASRPCRWRRRRPTRGTPSCPPSARGPPAGRRARARLVREVAERRYASRRAICAARRRRSRDGRARRWRTRGSRWRRGSVACLVPHPDVLAAGDRELGVAHLRHVREGMPQGGVAHGYHHGTQRLRTADRGIGTWAFA